MMQFLAFHTPAEQITLVVTGIVLGAVAVIVVLKDMIDDGKIKL